MQVNAMRVRRNSAESIRIQPQDIQQRTLHSHIAYPCLRFRRLIGAMWAMVITCPAVCVWWSSDEG